MGVVPKPGSPDPEVAARNPMDTAFLETAWLWSRVGAAVFGILTAVAVVFALTIASRLATARQMDLERLTSEMRTAIESAEAKVAEAEHQAALARAAAEEALQNAQENAATPAPAVQPTTVQIPAPPAPALQTPAAQTPAAPTPPVQKPAGEPPRTTAPGNTVSNRHLTVQQRVTLIALLRAAAEPRLVELSWVATNESYAFASEIRTALQDAGWRAHLTGGMLTPSPPAGILLTASVLSDDTVVLPSAFQAVGVQVRVTVDQSMPTDLVKLTVGNADGRP